MWNLSKPGNNFRWAILAVMLLFSTAVGAQDLTSYVFPTHPLSKCDFSKGGHGYPAIDIFCKPGAIFVAVTPGVIEDINKTDQWDPKINDPASKGGIWVSLRGDDGFRYYGSHLEKVEEGLTVGQKVRAGQTLGIVGHTGNAKNTPTHLHFGISKADDPYTWKTRRGIFEPYLFLKCLTQKGCDPGARLPKK